MSGPRNHGMSPREQEIMDLSDAGGLIEKIGRQLGLARDHVAAVVRNYSFATCWTNSQRFERAARAADRRYAAALAATGRRYT